MDDSDWLIASIEAIEAAAATAHEALHAAVDAIQPVRTERLAGDSLPVLVERMVAQGGIDVRRSAAAAFSDFERAVMVFRAGIVRTLVDQHGLTLSAIARLLEISRQRAARLYELAEDEMTTRPETSP
jgi:hypothetical protein